MKISRSIHAQLLVWLIIALSVIGVFSLIDAYFLALQTAHSAYDRILTNSALTIAERIYVDDTGKLSVDIPYVALDMLASNARDRVYYRVDASGELITGYRQLQIPLSEEETQWQYGQSKIRDEAIRYATLTGSASNGLVSLPYTVTVAETQNARKALIRSIFLRSFYRQIAIVIGASIIIWIAISRALRPLQRLTKAIGRRRPSDLRPIEHKVPSEFEGLVNETNGLMSRLSNSLDALKRFTSNAGHQLRTPMSVARTELTLAKRANAPQEKDAGIDAGLDAITGAERTLSQLLMLARLRENQSYSQEFQQVNISELAQEISREFAIQAQQRGIKLSFVGDRDYFVHAEKILLGEAIKNLLDNALRHPKACSWIEVETSLIDRKIICKISNDGLSAVREIKTGLGLSIVEEIIEYFGGVIEISTVQKERLVISLIFPV